MGILLYGIGLIIGIIIFVLINRLFNIFYFGFAAIISTFMGCWFAGVIIVYLLGGIIMYIIIGLVIILILAKIFGKKKDTKSD